MDDLIAKVREMANMDLSYRDIICGQLATNRYREALSAVFLERKELIRDHIDSSIFYGMHSAHRMQEVLETNLETGELHLTEEEQKDEEIVELERRYQSLMKSLRHQLYCTLNEIEQGRLAGQKHITDILREQMRWRPIEQSNLDRARDAVTLRHDRAREECKEAATNTVLLLRNRISEARKRRRNFSREATDKLQQYFEAHKEHPYPTDEEKERLAAECNISVQQVSNWFGNRRIRNRKTQKTEEEQDIDLHSNYGHQFSTQNQEMGYYDLGMIPSQSTEMNHQDSQL